MNGDAPNMPRPAATLILVRGQPPEIYLVKRHGRSGFMAGAHVFPGGRVDEGDRAWMGRLDDTTREKAIGMFGGTLGPEDAVAFAMAAVRETAEECGLLLAKTTSGPATADLAREVFEALGGGRTDGVSFAGLLDERGLLPDLDRLSSFSWWITPAAEPKRYDTRFFLAEAPADQLATVDAHEVTEGEWMSAELALARYAAAEIALAPPTLATLEDLAGLPDLAAFRAEARPPDQPVQPEMFTGDDGRLVLSLPGDPKHPVAKPVWPDRRSRFVLEPDEAQMRFRSEWVTS